ncbi:hypothetical protein AX774_g16 [Zancudomyces culisetae]|uniref:Uncharacterized protein n=1 Tax=Zancudomyces culisetae TaxID=1213189 RepID=A0A1R1PZP1_ZANCU|nr:hypothetical protein AX774_g16 [Zancudomyces culisetae]|eukprot:OMH86428.1 hypothetical protein AX774_g16 [Zancudomyces culisetae]
MSGLIKQLRSAIIQQFQDNGRYSSDGARSGVSSMDVEPGPSHGPLAQLGDIVQHKFLTMGNSTKECELPGWI